MMRRILLALLVLNSSLSAFAEDLRIGVPAAQVEAIDAAIAEQIQKQSLIGVAVGYLSDGQLVFTKGYGLADLQKEIPVSSDTVFNWASNSKPVAALIAMQLWEQQRLDLDRDVRDYVPEFPKKKYPVTTRLILAHQSGIPHYTNGKIIPAEDYEPGDSSHDPVVAIGTFCHSPLIFEPGERYSYSSYAYVLLSAVCQRAAKQPFEELVRDRVARPLKLTSLQWDVATADQPHWSRGYYTGPLSMVLATPEQAHFWKHGAGGFKSNIVDFGRWAEAVLNQRLIRQETWKEMMTTPKPRNGSHPKMALGINVEGEGKSLKLSHSGSQGEARSRMVVYPNQRHGMVVLTNSSHADVSAITTAVYRALQQVSAK